MWIVAQITDDQVLREWVRGQKLTCAICHGPGATLGCRGIDKCGQSWHYCCARDAAQRGKISFSADVFEAACGRHMSK